MSATRYQSQIQSAVGDALDGTRIYVCDQPASTGDLPPTPLATLYTDTSAGVTSDNPVFTDGNGNYDFYAVPGLYTLVIDDPLERIEEIIIPDIAIFPIGAGSGTVTSVGLNMPAEFSVAGSPVDTSGTLVVTKAVENALTVWAGPTGGPAAVPTFKLLTDLLTAAGIVGTGTVTSIAIAQSLSSLLSGSVSGSPITTSGTITLTINFANQSANTVLAGPASGGAGAVTARRIVPADFPLDVSVAFNAGSPVFDASASNVFSLTLTGDANFGTITNGSAGQVIWIAVAQDGAGGHAFAWPANTRGGAAVDTGANNVTIQGFKLSSGSLWRAVTSGNTTLA